MNPPKIKKIYMQIFLKDIKFLPTKKVLKKVMNNINIDATIDCISIENAKPEIIPIVNNDK